MANHERLITSDQILKLGHPIQEIRHRALQNIKCKLDSGYNFDNELARTRELLTKLLGWFVFEPCNDQKEVLELLQRIFQSKTGKLVVIHCGKSSIKLKLEEIQRFIDPEYVMVIQSLIEIVDSCEYAEVDVPPLYSEIPLSYRSDTSENPPVLGSTATTIRGYLAKDASLDQQIGNTKFNSSTQDFTNNPSNSASSDSLLQEDIFSCSVNGKVLPKLVLPWQHLIDTDRNILKSVEKALMAAGPPGDLLCTCEFFTDVMLHDFPAEVFLQRPNIVLIFNNLLRSNTSTKLTNKILDSLLNLTRALKVRVNHCSDPNMQHLKNDLDLLTLPTFLHDNENHTESAYSLQSSEEIKAFKEIQLTITEYCFQTLSILLKCLTLCENSQIDYVLKLNSNGTNLSISLQNEILNLLFMALTDDIWQAQNSPKILKILADINEILACYGNALEYFRIESMSLESDSKARVIYLCLLQIAARFLKRLIPVSRSKFILPKKFKITLVNSLMDVSLTKLYPDTSKCILDYVESFVDPQDLDAINKYKRLTKICSSLKAAVKFLTRSSNLGFKQRLTLADAALQSLEFHKNLKFVEEFIEMCSDHLYGFRENEALQEKAESILVKILAHSMIRTREMSYKLCHQKVLEYIGVNAQSYMDSKNGTRIYFILRSKTLREIILFGLTDTNVSKYAEGILLNILKCKPLVSEDIWDICVQRLISVIGYLFCFADNKSNLGRNIIGLADPDTAKTLKFPKIVMFKANLQLLFSRDLYIREEAFSRVCWLLAGQPNSKDLLPKIMTVFDKALANSCEIRRIVDINKLRQQDHFYQPSSLIQVLELLKSSNVEPVIRRSALSQISVIMEDCLLHDVFFENGGIDLILDVMKSALTEKDYKDYPDAIVPVISVLKNVVLYHSTLREDLALNEEVFYYALRGLFLFFTDEKMRQDCVTLLFLLIFKDCVVGSPSRSDLSVLALLKDNVMIPFTAHFHGATSEFTEQSFYDGIVNDKWCLSSLQIQWSIEICGGFETLIKLENVSENQNIDLKADEILCLREHDLKILKSSCVQYGIERQLYVIENATSYVNVVDAIAELTLYTILYDISSHNLNAKRKTAILECHWDKPFLRFLKRLPSSKEDVLLLKCVMNFFMLLTPLYKTSENFWLISQLKESSNAVLDLLYADSVPEEDVKLLSQELVKEITMCAVQEHRYLDYCCARPVDTSQTENWGHVIKILADNLRFSNTEHFYDIAYLDAQLCCLAHLTAILGWSKSRPIAASKDAIPNLVFSLCKLVSAFHCGKGRSATVSFMGLSITKNVLFVLNNLLTEKYTFKTRNWERYFFEYVEENDQMPTFLTLWFSRDAVIRAASIQLFSILSTHADGASKIITDFERKDTKIWDTLFKILTDDKEAAIVRENAFIFLNILLVHSASFNSFKVFVMDLFTKHDFYDHLYLIFTSLFTLKVLNNQNGLDILERESANSKSSDSSDYMSIVTPGLVKSVCQLLLNMEHMFPGSVGCQLEENGLVNLIFSIICNPLMDIKCTKELVLYSDLLEMNVSTCRLLRKLALSSGVSLGTILHNQGCLNNLFSLLDAKIYHIHLTQFLCLRNQLWTEIFNLVAALCCFDDENDFSLRLEAHAILINTINLSGIEKFFDVLFESLSCIGTHDLQKAALVALISILKTECLLMQHPEIKSASYNLLSSALDGKKSRKTVVLISTDNKENIDSNSDKSKLLHQLYFDGIIKNSESSPETNDVVEENRSLMLGAETCKILLYLYDIATIEMNVNNNLSLVISALSSSLCVSQEVKKYAMTKNLAGVITKELKDSYIKLSTESIESLKRIQDKKRICPILKSVNDLIGLLTNFLLNNEHAKIVVIGLNLADILHKLWIWFSFRNVYIADVMRLLAVYTTDCCEACRSLTSTSAIAGSKPKKSSSNTSLLHVIIYTVAKELDQVSKTHELHTLQMAFQILNNCSESFDCRILILKSNIFHAAYKLHPSISKRQFPWDQVENLWLQFLHNFTRHPEGQSAVTKSNEVLELTYSMALSSKISNRETAMGVLRNVAFYRPNRPRLLASGDFLSILQSKLTTGSQKEKHMTIIIIWALVANNQKAAQIFKAAGFEVKLENIIKNLQLTNEPNTILHSEDVEGIKIVFNILRR